MTVGEKPTPKVIVNVRVGNRGVSWLDELAAEYTDGVRAEVIRHALAVAKKHENEVIARLQEYQT